MATLNGTPYAHSGRRAGFSVALHENRVQRAAIDGVPLSGDLPADPDTPIDHDALTGDEVGALDQAQD